MVVAGVGEVVVIPEQQTVEPAEEAEAAELSAEPAVGHAAEEALKATVGQATGQSAGQVTAPKEAVEASERKEPATVVEVTKAAEAAAETTEATGAGVAEKLSTEPAVESDEPASVVELSGQIAAHHTFTCESARKAVPFVFRREATPFVPGGLAMAQAEMVEPLISELAATEDSMAAEAAEEQVKQPCGPQGQLPIWAEADAICRAVRSHSVAVVVAETGSGKSTQLPQMLDAACVGGGGRVLCTQPRKIAAISLAQRVASECGQGPLGGHVGYKVGCGNERMSHSTRLLFCTDRVAVRMLQEDPSLPGIGVVIADEAHERSLWTDLLLAALKRSLAAAPHLRVVITSATIDPTVFQSFFARGVGGSEATEEEVPVISAGGRVFPVSVQWLQAGGRQAGGKTTLPAEPSPPDLAAVIEPAAERAATDRAVEEALRIHRADGGKGGHMLAFLTSPAEVERAAGAAAAAAHRDPRGLAGLLPLPLHGRLTMEDQQRVFAPVRGRKLVFATNVAETSVTVDGVGVVIDTGLAKEVSFDARRGTTALAVRRISQSAAEQRRGRAGRTRAGLCLRLFSEQEFATMEPRGVPELLRVSLSHAVAQLLEFGVEDVLTFEMINSPSPEALRSALRELASVGAIVPRPGGGQLLTSLGRQLAALPVEVRLGRMALLGQERGVGDAAAICAVLMSSSGIFFRGFSNEERAEADIAKLQFCRTEGDVLTMVDVYRAWSRIPESQQNAWCVEHSVNAKSMRGARDTLREMRFTMTNTLRLPRPKGKGLAVSSAAEADALVRLIFDCFADAGCCIYRGHPRLGYSMLGFECAEEALNGAAKEAMIQKPQEPQADLQTESAQKQATLTNPNEEEGEAETALQELVQQVLLHPSSAHCALGITPDWITYTRLHRTSAQFAMGVTAVDELHVQRYWGAALVARAVASLRVERLPDRPFGAGVLWQLLGPSPRKLEEQLCSISGGPVVLEAERLDLGSGDGQTAGQQRHTWTYLPWPQVFVAASNREVVEVELARRVDALREAFAAESEVRTFGPGGRCSAMRGQGGHVRELMPPESSARSLQALLVCEWRLRECSEYDPQQPHLVTHEDVSSHLESLGCRPSACVPSWDLGRVAGLGPADRPVCSACFASLEEAARARTVVDKSWQQWSWLQHAWVGLLHLSRSQPLVDITDHFSRGPADVRTLMVQMFASRMLAVPWQQKQHVEILNTLFAENPHGGGLSVIHHVVVAVQRLLERMMADLGMASADADGRKAKAEIELSSEGESSDGSVAELGQEWLSQAEPDFWDYSTMPQWTPDVVAALLHNAFCLLGRVLARSSTHRHRSAPHKEIARLQIHSLFERLCCAPEPGGSRGTRERKAKKRGRQQVDSSKLASQGRCPSRFSLLAGLLASQGQTIFYAFLNGGMVDVMLQRLEACVQQVIRELESAEPPEGSVTLLSQAFEFLSTAPSSKGTSKGLRGGADFPAVLRRLAICATKSVAAACRQSPATAVSILACIIPHLGLNTSGHPAFDDSMFLGGYESEEFGGGLTYAGDALTSSIFAGQEKLLVTAVTAWSELQRLQLEAGDSEATALMWEASHVLGQLLKSQIIGDSLTPDTACTVLQQLELAGGSPGMYLPSEIEARRDALLLRFLWLVHRSAVSDRDRGGQRWNLLDYEWCMALQASVTLALDAAWPQAGKLNQPHGGQAASATSQSELKPHLARWAIQTLVELAGTQKDEITAVSKRLGEVAGRLWPPQEGALQQAGPVLVSQRLSFMLLLETLVKQQCFSRGLSLDSQGRPLDPTDDHGICLRAVAEWAAANAQRDPGFGNCIEVDLPKLESTACVACRLALQLPMQHPDHPERARAVLFRACGVVLAPLSGSPTAKAAEGAARVLSSLMQDVLSAGADCAGPGEEGETNQPGLRHEATGAAMLLSLLDSWLPSSKQLPKEGPVSQTGMLATMLCMGTLAGLGCPTPQKALLGRLSAAAALALRAAAQLAVDLPEARQKAASTAKLTAELPAPAGRKARRRTQKGSDKGQPTAAADAAAARLASLQTEARSWAALAECIDATAGAVQEDRFWPYPRRGEQGRGQEGRQDSLPLEDASLVELARTFGIRRRGPNEGPIDGKRAASVEPSAFLGALRSTVESGQAGDLIIGTWCLEGTSMSIVKQGKGLTLQYDGTIGFFSRMIPLYPLATAADNEDLQVTSSLQWAGVGVGVKVLLLYDPVLDSLRIQSTEEGIYSFAMRHRLQLQSGEAVRCQQPKTRDPLITSRASATAARPEEDEALKGAFELLSRHPGHAKGRTFFSEDASRRLANALTAGARAAVGRELRRLELDHGQCIRAGPLRPIEDGLRVEALVGRRSYLGHGFVEWSSREDWSRAQDAFLGWLNREIELPDGLTVVLSLNSAEHASTTWGYRVTLDPKRSVTEAELKSAVDTAVKLWGGAGGKKGGRVGCTAKVVVTEKFHDFPAGLERLQLQLRELCPAAVHIQVAPPHDGDMDYKVVFHGLRPEQASDVPRALAGVRFQQDVQRDRKAPPPRVECRFAASAQLGRAVLSASSVSAELVRLSKELEADGLELRAHDAKGGRRESVEYEVLGTDATRIAGACEELCRLGTGRSVPVEDPRAFRKAADPSFRGILRQVAQDTRTHVLLDRRTCALCVFGSTVAQRDAEVALRGLLAPERLDFFIDRGHLSGQALKGLFATYGKQLGGFRDVLPEGVTMDFDVAHALLTVRSCRGAEPDPKRPLGQPSCAGASGNHSRSGRAGASGSAASGGAGDKKWKKKEAPAVPEPPAEAAEDSRLSPMVQAEASIAACLRAAGTRPRQADRPSADCVVCFCPIEEEGPFFLELCGHAVCTACAANQVRSALGLDGLPLRCAREGCGTLFALEDVRQLARRGLLDERRLFEAALSEYVRGHQDTVRFCPTPDCQSIYPVTADCSSFLCGLCGVEVCAAHHERQVGGKCSKTSRSLGVAAWIDEDPVRRKRCPKCSIGLEKVGGCEHITCLACKAHICWKCLKVFKEASECYSHLREVHGSIGLVEDAGLF